MNVGCGHRGASILRMHATLVTAVCVSTAVSAAHAQHATVVGRVVVRESGEPLGYASISVLPGAEQRLAGAGGAFVLRNLPPGEIRLRFRHIGFAPRDTTLVVGANDTAQVRIEMTRLALSLPTVVVDGTCTDRTPFEERPADLTALYDQVVQNAERLRLLARERPFAIEVTNTRGIEGRGSGLSTDTIVRGPLPQEGYAPRRILRPFGGRRLGGVMLPELADIADTAFTNNHCLWYAGHERFGSDSVVRVDFEPVPWLAREVDFEGSIFVRVDGYQLVGMITRLNRIPGEWQRTLQGYGTRARFDELVSGVPVLAEFEITNTFRDSPVPVVVQRSRVLGVRWVASPPGARDTPLQYRDGQHQPSSGGTPTPRGLFTRLAPQPLDPEHQEELEEDGTDRCKQNRRPESVVRVDVANDVPYRDLCDLGGLEAIEIPGRPR